MMMIKKHFPDCLKSLYMDPNGELCITFTKKLTEDEIKTVLFELEYFGPYSPAPEGPSAMKLEYGTTHCYTEPEETEIYSKDGFNFRNY